MSTTVIADVLVRNRKKTTRYGVTEAKKAELDALTLQVQDAQDDVEQLQAMVTSLSAKSSKLQVQLNDATTNRATALNNKDMVDDVIQNTKDLMNNSSVTFDEVVIADAKIKDVAKEIRNVINKLIYSAEVINKLANLVIRKKASNPLISDELITMVTNSGTDANNAVAVTLVALNSVFASQATTLESEAALSLEYLQAVKLCEFISGQQDAHEIYNRLPKRTIKELLDTAYIQASERYEQALVAYNDTVNQVNEAKSLMDKAQIKLSSLEAGLAAANAAALAS